jgi:hypothetical protein
VRFGASLVLPFILLLLATNDVRANGRYPTAGVVAFDPRDAQHLAVRTTFGLLESRDGGGSFEYVCESALRLGIEEDPMPAFTASGSLVVATFGGVVSSEDGCDFRVVPELEGQVVPDLARSASEPDTLVLFRLLGRGGGLYESGLVRTEDGGSSFTFFPLLTETLLPITVDLAARERSRVYLTARRGEADGYDSVLMVSDDGGETFRERSIPGTAEQHLAYIAGVHPHDVDRLAVRVNDTDRTILLETRDAGTTFETLFTASGRLTGFAYSPDGAEIAFGGLDEGLWGGSSDATEYERRSDVAPTCLAWNDAGLWACADRQTAGFSLGRSTDAGRTFEPLLAFAELCGRSSCGGETDVGALCSNDWQIVGPSLGATCGLDGGNVPDGGRPPDAGSSSNDAAPPSGRAGCAIGPPFDRRQGGLAWLAYGMLLAARRGASSPRSFATARGLRPRS